MTLTGPASVPPTCVCEVFKKVVKKYPSKPALRVKRNGEWITWTFKQYYMDVAKGAKSMIRLGLEPFNGVCVLGFNSPEWFISYLCGIMVRPSANSSTEPIHVLCCYMLICSVDCQCDKGVYVSLFTDPICSNTTMSCSVGT